jgi:nitroimidazol reductase NimA-like FMN-containing flavoprotein (pyridoxamine 5'-phosphate oxidase superfamily)
VIGMASKPGETPASQDLRPATGETARCEHPDMDASQSQGPVVADGADIDVEARDAGTMEVLDVQQCWELLASVEVGRLAVAAAGDVDIFPLNFAIDDGAILFRSAEGTKLVEVVLSGRVAFEVDGYEPARGRAWSVVAKGSAELIDRFSEIYRVEDLPLFPWNASPKERFVRIVPDKLSGRRFTVAQTRGGGTPAL